MWQKGTFIQGFLMPGKYLFCSEIIPIILFIWIKKDDLYTNFQ